ncbi:ABC transporter ATP-binding protein [Bacteroidales bacterium OttesenSCG-928-K03]|nr:ABC transporter ATP-binding protein [Bacteroidales bacterium OttesenSCG-928-L14]MDL2242541.1 ABC transporter ATP-binding protein [Bacteroidales bacterium OttesenSCG-928-K03]
MIRADNISTGYRSNSEKSKGKKFFVVHSELNFSLNRGELVCLIGENGAGKSTLIKTLCGFIPLVSGNLFVDEKNINELNSRDIASEIGVVLSNAPDLNNMTAYEVVCMGRYPFTGMFGKLTGSDYEKVDEAIGIIGAGKLKHKNFNMMSDGEKQKIMIAKTLAQQTPNIIMDEPMAFLDFPSKIEMINILKNLAHNHDKAVLISTHNLEIALDMADKLWLMNAKGNFIQTTSAELIENNLLEEYFNKETAEWILGR